MIFATFYDLFTMTIPNRITMALIVGFIVLAPLAGMGLITMAWHFGVAILVLIVGFMLFNIGVMGGGDAKLLAASALWFGTAFTLPYVLLAGIFGGALTLVIIVARNFSPPAWVLKVEWIMRLYDKKSGVPYGIALGPAAMIIFTATPWFDYIVSGKAMI